jgi:5'-3' exonuclease
MGIPSFYKRLLTVHKGLVTKQRPTVLSLYLDFNCLIYHCARRPGILPYDGANHDTWEKTLLDEIVKYVSQLWREAGQPSEVFLAVDGVVPLAKIKQQRLRRFKSAWLSQEERALGIRSGASWDTNCITPGTLFMERLGLKLRELCHKKAGWSVSDADEPGEGEQKVMVKVREKKAGSTIIIYGLDADLILLSLLNGRARDISVFLMREDTEFGLPGGGESYSYLSVDVLSRSLWGDFESLTVANQVQRIQNYVAGMSLLGNDFLPHSLSIKVREDGHERLARDLLELDCQLLTTRGDGYQEVNREALYLLFEKWSVEEERLVCHSIKKKFQMKGRVAVADAAAALSARPLEWSVEQEVLSIKKDKEGKSIWSLQPWWINVYHEKWMGGVDIDVACAYYIYGVQWIYDYYTGQKPVDLFWMYPSLLPPLWSDLYKFRNKPCVVARSSRKEPLKPQEQLALVLPFSSWALLRDKKLRELPFTYPQFWCKEFTFFSVGRSMLWECEANIPFFPISRLYT